MTSQLRFLGWIASIGAILACGYLFLAVFSGRSGCQLSDVFASDCSGARSVAFLPFVGVVVGVAILLWMYRADESEQPMRAIMGLVYSGAVFLMFLAYAGSMLGGMH